MLRLVLLAVLLTSCCLAPAAEDPADPYTNLYFADPGLRGLMDWVTYRCTFDAGSVLPDMAAGDYAVRSLDQPVFLPGLRGLALQCGGGSGYAMLKHQGNIPLESRGAAAFWVCPVAWTHVRGDNTVFLMSAGGGFYLERQGPDHSAAGELTRQEGLLYLIQSPATGNMSLYGDTMQWPPGEWRLVVLNWDWPSMSLSINGGEFSSTTARGKPDPAQFGGLIIGASGGETALMDELLIFKRPLSLAETRIIYEALKPAAPEVKP